MMQRYKLDISILFFSTLGFAFACVEEDSLDIDETSLRGKEGGLPGKGGMSGKKGGGSSGDGGVAVAGDGSGEVISAIACSDGKIYPCGDMLDNDGDGLVDYDDPECTTPCDNHEGSFLTDLPGQNEDCKSDCYFDDNTGAGDDECEQDLQCDPENPGALIGCEYDSELECADPTVQSGVCLDTCMPLVPNGCDCFGCCLIADQYVYLDGSLDCNLDNLAGCQSCTFNDVCANTCEPENCELCVGQTPDQLPPQCKGEPACGEGITTCTSHLDCGGDGTSYCQTGCCVSFN